jgi:hypothetical protein
MAFVTMLRSSAEQMGLKYINILLYRHKSRWLLLVFLPYSFLSEGPAIRLDVTPLFHLSAGIISQRS